MQTASSGDALKLQASLKDISQGNTFIQSAFHAAQPFRVRDVRKYSATSKLVIDHPGLRSMIAIPIRWHRLSIGAILAFGKQNEVFFTENDASLAELLSIQAASVFESTWLQQELRTSLSTTSLLYRLSTQIIQAENLYDAAVDIAQTAHKLAKGESAGIVLFSLENQVEAEVEIDSSGLFGSAQRSKSSDGNDPPGDGIRTIDLYVSRSIHYQSLSPHSDADPKIRCIMDEHSGGSASQSNQSGRFANACQPVGYCSGAITPFGRIPPAGTGDKNCL